MKVLAANIKTHMGVSLRSSNTVSFLTPALCQHNVGLMRVKALRILAVA